MTGGTAPSIVVFDIGQVLIEWDPRHLYRELFDGYEDLMEDFLERICSPAWNLEQDRGRPWSEAVAQLAAEHPDCAELIRAYDDMWERMVPGPIPGTPEILAELKARGAPVYAITNFSADKFDLTCRRFDFLNGFDGIIVSGRERLVKPDPAIFHLLTDRYGLEANRCFFIDDNPDNVESAKSVGMSAHLFLGAEALRRDLEAVGLL
ncbi:2-haloalkanoic acid dehalogenase [Azospirillum thiophilum]|uniref:2-haloalkanoic acid dehalogenase n=1 Tax=Azospirillum thiophilum TaxID=528244 RepID=A0AAC8VWS1_9PROT|nr:HAD family phosphatase [Azospirillum thiophilum]ALG70715.1 2-haloalkanoic acid dehalogenase [Azospirillum thiophilum]KJR65619.1 2-haloalkanoic acid dehalogenase [Azospirillum thiophilum]